jgi:hypothetical protein
VLVLCVELLVLLVVLVFRVVVLWLELLDFAEEVLLGRTEEVEVLCTEDVVVFTDELEVGLTDDELEVDVGFTELELEVGFTELDDEVDETFTEDEVELEVAFTELDVEEETTLDDVLLGVGDGFGEEPAGAVVEYSVSLNPLPQTSMAFPGQVIEQSVAGAAEPPLRALPQ